jgi:hypothetical protein
VLRLSLLGIVCGAAAVYWAWVWRDSYRRRSAWFLPKFWGDGKRWHRDTDPWNYWTTMVALTVAAASFAAAAVFCLYAIMQGRS